MSINGTQSARSPATCLSLLLLSASLSLCGCWRQPVVPEEPPAADGTATPPTTSQTDPQPDAIGPAGQVDPMDPIDTAGTPDPLPCTTCHTMPMGTRRAVAGASGSGLHLLSSSTLTNIDCTLCHETEEHMDGQVRLWSDPNARNAVTAFVGYPLADAVEEEASTTFCLSCHDAADYGLHTPAGQPPLTCVVCHDVHNPANGNRSLVRDALAGVPVTFTATTGSGSFSDGVCRACHTSTAYHRSNGTGSPHNDGTDCTACHSHNAGFLPSQSASCIECHSVTQGARSPVANATGAGGHHLRSGALADGDCVKCHDQSTHREGSVRVWTNANSPTESIVVSGDPSRLTSLCLSCHNGANHPATHATGTSWEPACTECHAIHEPAHATLSLVRSSIPNRTSGVSTPVSFVARTGAGSFSDGICSACHSSTTFHRSDGAGASHNDGADCTLCHSHGSGFQPDQSASCTECHSMTQGTRPAVVNASGTGGHHLGSGALTDGDCVKCHDQSTHRQGTVRVWSDANNPTASLAVTGDPDQLTGLCLSCHNTGSAPAVHPTGGSWTPACTECHAMHEPSSANLALVRSSVRHRTTGVDTPVSFVARTGTGSFSDGVCTACHATTTYHRSDGTGASHNDGADCTTCHAHRAGFAPSGATSCTACHGTPQGTRRSVTGEFALASHHAGGASVTDGDCTVCHDMSEHRSGSVRLINVDDPTNTALVVSLATDPMTDPAAASLLEPFCLACHDTDGANGSAPFADGQMPVAIDAATWTSSSHRAGQMRCIGDGSTFGCHSSGHGSKKRSMLAPWDASQTAVSGDPLREEEGFCYACHDASGPASSDIESAFALASHHNVSALDQTDGSRVECVNCHNPHKAATGARLIDPDTHTVWTGSDQDFCLVCHDGAAPAGVTFPPTSTGTGFNKSVFVGTTHDLQLGADACGHCHAPHGTAHAPMLDARYVVADNNNYSTGDGDYALCWQCHGENAVIQQDNAFEDLHKKHVKGERSPCIICHDVHVGFDSGEVGLIDLAYAVQAGYDVTFLSGDDGSSSFWLNSGGGRGSCAIRCHGKKHDPKSYDRLGGSTTDCSACHASQP